MICVGYTSASWVGVGFYFVQAGGAQWRIPLALQSLFPALLAAGVLFLPESPRWRMISNVPHNHTTLTEPNLVLDHDRADEAYVSFKKVRAETSDDFLDDEDAIRADFALLNGQIANEKHHHVSTLDLFRLPRYRKRLAIGVIMMVGAQATGTQIINSMFPYDWISQPMTWR